MSILTTSQVADLLKISQRQVQLLINAGYFPNAYQLTPGRRSPWRIPESDVEQYVNQRKNEVKILSRRS